MGTYAITGCSGGIGSATRRQLEKAGHRVIGVDLTGTDVSADLSTSDGRASMVEEVTALSGGSLDGIVAGAGVLGGRRNAALVIAVNYFGALATLEGLRPMLSPGGTAVAISSVSATTSPLFSVDVLQACLDGDEERACAVPTDGLSAYAASKLALARRVRMLAVSPKWVGAGLRLNAVLPGLVDTPMTSAHLSMWLDAGEANPMPMKRAARPEELAEPICWLLSPPSSFCVGTAMVVDGGTEAMLRPADYPVPLPAATPARNRP